MDTTYSWNPSKPINKDEAEFCTNKDPPHPALVSAESPSALFLQTPQRSVNKLILTSLIVTTASVFTSCETILEPTADEHRETQANIRSGQSSLGRQAAAKRDRAEELDNASRMSRRGAADGYPDTSDIDHQAADARNEAEELDTARRMMGRGAAN